MFLLEIVPKFDSDISRELNNCNPPDVLGDVKTSAMKWLKDHCSHHIETRQLICIANQLTGFYMRVTLTFLELINSVL